MVEMAAISLKNYPEREEPSQRENTFPHQRGLGFYIIGPMANQIMQSLWGICKIRTGKG